MIIAPFTILFRESAGIHRCQQSPRYRTIRIIRPVIGLIFLDVAEPAISMATVFRRWIFRTLDGMFCCSSCSAFGVSFFKLRKNYKFYCIDFV